jgi:signal recognition particle GTPase
MSPRKEAKSAPERNSLEVARDKFKNLTLVNTEVFQTEQVREALNELQKELLNSDIAPQAVFKELEGNASLAANIAKEKGQPSEILEALATSFKTTSEHFSQKPREEKPTQKLSTNEPKIS